MAAARNNDNQSTDLAGKWSALLFGIRRSVRYHMRRQRFFERWHMFTSAMAVIFGSATVVMVLSKLSPWLTAGAAIIVTVFSAVDLVVGTSKAARLHNDLARRFIALEKSMVLVGDPTEADNRQFTAERLAIEADEPPILRVLDVLCHNELMRAMGFSDSDLVQVGPVRRGLAQFVDWRSGEIKGK